MTFSHKTDIIWLDATVAQSVEQLIRNQQAAGSSPASSSKKGAGNSSHKHAGCAEWYSLQNIYKETAGSMEEPAVF